MLKTGELQRIGQRIDDSHERPPHHPRGEQSRHDLVLVMCPGQRPPGRPPAHKGWCKYLKKINEIEARESAKWRSWEEYGDSLVGITSLFLIALRCHF